MIKLNTFNRMMIIDDNSTDNYLNQMILKAHQICNEITVFTNPVSALVFFRETIEKNEAAKIPDVILLDINMPLMTGFEFLDEFLKLSSPLTANIKFYMLSSSDNQADMEKMKLYGNRIIKSLKKPLDKNEFAQNVD